VGQDHAADLAHRGAKRAWLISLRDSAVPDPPDIKAALQGCSLVRTFTARRIRAELYDVFLPAAAAPHRPAEP
jgi:hypothetical protein